MGEQVERLQASGIGEISRVSVGTECYVCIGGVGEGKVGDEVIEAAIMCFSDECNLLQQLLSRFRRVDWYLGDECETIASLVTLMRTCRLNKVKWKLLTM